MSTTAETSDATKILEAKIKAFNKQWQEYNQNWTNISKITRSELDKDNKYSKYGVTLVFTFSEDKDAPEIKKIEYDNKIIKEEKDGKFHYNLYNLPNHFGIRINEDKEHAVCYKKENEQVNPPFSVGDLIYRDGDSFIITKDPTTSGYYFTIDPVNKRWVATYKTTFFSEVGSTFYFNFMQRLDSPYTYFNHIAVNSYRDYVIQNVNEKISNCCRENYGMEAPFHLYTMKRVDNTYEEIYDDQTWYFRSEVENGVLKNNLVVLHEKPVSAESFYQLVR